MLELGTRLLQGLHEAIEMNSRHTSLHMKFTESFPPDTIRKWESEVVAWERDPTQPNPFDDEETKREHCWLLRQSN